MKLALTAGALFATIALGIGVYVVIPNSKPKATVPAAQAQIVKFLGALQKSNWKAACDTLQYYSLNQGVSEPICETIMQGNFGGQHLVYKMIGTSQASAKYAVVTVAYAMDDPSTKVNESAVCEAQWAKGLDCKYGGAYTFGMALAPSVADAFKKKNVVKHWYIAWVD